MLELSVSCRRLHSNEMYKISPFWSPDNRNKKGIVSILKFSAVGLEIRLKMSKHRALHYSLSNSRNRTCVWEKKYISVRFSY